MPVLNKIKSGIKIILLIFLLAIFWSAIIKGSPLYLIEVLENSNIKDNTDSNIPVIRYLNDSAATHPVKPTERTIILRLDDVQGYLWRDIVINLTDTILERNMSVTLAVIPARGMDKDAVIRNYLLNKVKDPRIEIAQHGFSHQDNEYLNFSYADAYNITVSGQDILRKYLRVEPVTFIPPYNEYNDDTIKALYELGFKIISAKKDEYQFNGSMTYIGYDTETKRTDDTDLVPVSDVLNKCKKSFNEKNVCIIMIHPQDYIGDDKRTMDQGKYQKFVQLLDGLQNMNARFVTFRDLIK